MLMQSWPAYEHYTGVLGTQTLTDITGSHYGPNIEASERNGWGQWHFDDDKGIGMDRTVATGTGFGYLAYTDLNHDGKMDLVIVDPPPAPFTCCSATAMERFRSRRLTLPRVERARLP